MIRRPLSTFIVLFLWAALIEDLVIFGMSWLAPEIWFELFHASEPAGLEIALLRRSGGQWAGFALVQALALLRWRQARVWLAITAGLRASDLFTDILYIVAVPSLTPLGWIVLCPPPVLNSIMIVVMMLGYRQATSAESAPASAGP